jgi:Ca2+-transporting ATPase
MRQRSLPALVGQVLAEPMFLLLIGAAALYLLLGDAREAVVLASSLVGVATITVLQERRADRALEALRDLSSPRAAVVRDGLQVRIAGRDVVCGDIVLLNEGDRIPADGVLRSATDLAVDESLLTGESVAVQKEADPVQRAMAKPEAEARACVYSGTLVVRGHGVAEILAIGPHSEIGQIGRALLTLKAERTPLYRETRRLVRWVALLGVALCVAVALLYVYTRGGVIEAALAGITLAMAVLPEEFPIVLTVFLALGAWRLSKRKVLTRSMPAIETLGSATVLAVDKTGTLTENRMSVTMLDYGGSAHDLTVAGVVLDEAGRRLLGTALAACEIEPFDPMERAIGDAARVHARVEAEQLGSMTLVREYELSPALLAVTHVWGSGDGQPLRIAVKGAPEVVARLCGLHGDTLEKVLQGADALAGDGLRVLGVAGGTFSGDSFPESPRAFALEFRGLLALRDPVRASVPAALAECRGAGIRVVMITGDHVATARAIARQTGLENCDRVVTGAELAALDDFALRALVRAVNVYARTPPEQKLRLVRALRANGEVVAMTGDGVNDAPALKAAHIGIAMGSRGTDVAREAAALVLLDDDFGSLVSAVRTGRRIYENIRAAMTYLLAVHIPLAGIGLLPLLFGWPLLLFPLHVVFLEFVIDPACSLVFEGEERGEELMHRPPRDPRAPLFSRPMLLEALLLGVASLVGVTLLYAMALRWLPEGQARALGFIALVVGNLTLVLVNRSRDDALRTVLSRPNAAFWWISSLAIVALAIVVSVPAAAEAFRFQLPSPLGVAAAVLVAVITVVGLAYFRRPRAAAGECR